MQGKCQGFVLYRQTWQCNENITDCGGKRAVVLPTGCPRSVGLLAGICRTKVKCPAIPRGWGGPWLQITSALCCVLTCVRSVTNAAIKHSQLIVEIYWYFKLTLLTPSFRNHFFSNYHVLKHLLTNLILSSFYSAKV